MLLKKKNRAVKSALNKPVEAIIRSINKGSDDELPEGDSDNDTKPAKRVSFVDENIESSESEVEEDQPVMYTEDKIEEGQKRKITKQMQQNKGLKRQRTQKDSMIPRKKLRLKYDKAVSKLPTRRKRDTSKPYRGERSGIKKKISRSTNLQDR